MDGEAIGVTSKSSIPVKFPGLQKLQLSESNQITDQILVRESSQKKSASDRKFYLARRFQANASAERLPGAIRTNKLAKTLHREAPLKAASSVRALKAVPNSFWNHLLILQAAAMS
jgi:hypothetical protein